MERRSLLTVAVGLVSAGLVGALGTLATVYGRSTSRWRTSTRRWLALCREEEVEPGRPLRLEYRFPRLEGWYWQDVKREVFVLKEEGGELRVFSSRCTHLGCTVSWHDKDDQFLCRCHGGRFARDGAVVGGPPKDPLESIEYRILDGMVEVNAS